MTPMPDPTPMPTDFPAWECEGGRNFADNADDEIEGKEMEGEEMDVKSKLKIDCESALWVVVVDGADFVKSVEVELFAPIFGSR